MGHSIVHGNFIATMRYKPILLQFVRVKLYNHINQHYYFAARDLQRCKTCDIHLGVDPMD